MKTIMLTGGTGYIGSWVSKKLLEKGYTLRLTLRDKNRKEKYAHLQKIADKTDGELELWEADLLKPGSYDASAEGADAVIHMASPFKLDVKDAQKELVDPALEGTRNVLAAAEKSESVRKVVLTSSVVAVYGDNIDMQEKGINCFTEEHFNTTSSVDHQPYPFSKVQAEKEAWKIHDAQDRWKLVVINPSFVMGPSLTKLSDSESLSFMTDMLSGKFYPLAPALSMGFTDVRDVAEAHISALEKDDAEGRHIISAEEMSFIEYAELIREEFGKKYKLPTMKAPKLLLRVVGPLMGITSEFVKRNVGYPLCLDNSKSEKKLGISYRSVKKTAADMVRQMEEQGLV